MSPGDPTSLPIDLLLVIRHMNMGGAQRQLYNLATGLDPARFRPTVVCLHREEPLLDRLRERGIQAITLPARRGVDPSLPFRIARVAARNRARLLHSFLFAANAWGRIAARLRGIPAIVSERTVRPRRRRREIAVERLLGRWTAAYVVNSNRVGEMVRRYVPAVSDRLECIYNGIDLGEFRADREAARSALRRELGAAPQEILVGIVGTLHREKGHSHLLEAIHLLGSAGEGLRIVVIGEGGEREALLAQAAGIGLAGRLHLLGLRDDVPGLLCGLDILVQASLREGMPNAVLEGMAATLPIVATSVGGTAEALDEGRCGLLIPPADSVALSAALRSILEQPERARALALDGRRRVEEVFSREEMVRRTSALYERVLATPRDGT